MKRLVEENTSLGRIEVTQTDSQQPSFESKRQPEHEVKRSKSSAHPSRHSNHNDYDLMITS